MRVGELDKQKLKFMTSKIINVTRVDNTYQCLHVFRLMQNTPKQKANDENPFQLKFTNS